jgi:ABC-type nitrate/sulfonate/bicarbonate transport system substrate-binding protein
MINKKFSIVIFLVLTIFLICGCSQQEEKYTGPVETIVIAEGQQPIAGPVYVAYENGYFKEQGLEVTLQPHPSGKACLNAVLENQADFGTVAETPIVDSAISGQEICILSTIHNSDENTMVVGRKDSGISQINDLKEKNIGVSKGTNGEFFLSQFLLFNSISEEEINVVDVKPGDMVNSLMNKEVDAVATWHPHISNLQERLGDNNVSFENGGIYTETYNLVGLKKNIETNPDITKRVVIALVKAEKFIQEQPEESQQIIARSINMDLEQLKRLWHIYTFQISLEQTLVITLESETKWSIKNGLNGATESLNYLDYIYFDALEEVKPEAVTIIH